MDVTSSYGERIMELNRVPGQQRRQLAEIARNERTLLEKYAR